MSQQAIQWNRLGTFLQRLQSRLATHFDARARFARNVLASPRAGLPTCDPTTRQGDPAPRNPLTSGSSFAFLPSQRILLERPCVS